MSPALTLYLINQLVYCFQACGFDLSKMQLNLCSMLQKNLSPTDPMVPHISGIILAITQQNEDDYKAELGECFVLLPSVTEECPKDLIECMLNQFINFKTVINNPAKNIFGVLVILHGLTDTFNNYPEDTSQFYQDLKLLSSFGTNSIPSGVDPITLAQKCLNEYQNDQAA